MKTMVLGKTGLEVSRVGMGGIPIQRPTEEEAVKVIRRVLDLGVTFIDTARGYGNSEQRIGKAIAGRREQLVVATKTGARDKVAAQKDLERSLQCLQTYYIDLWQFHNLCTFEEYEQVLGVGGAMELAQEALRAGKIRHIGISSHSPDVAQRAVASGHFETIQFPFNLVARESGEKLVPLAQEHEVGFIAMKPFAGGQLQNASLVIKYLLQFEGVVPIPGIEKVEEIEEIADIVNESWGLTHQEREGIKAIRAELGTRFCRRCEYCMPCPQGVPITLLMTMHANWKVWPEAEGTIKWLDGVIEKGKNCTQCGECEEKCPYQLPIREVLVENIEFYESVRP